MLDYLVLYQSESGNTKKIAASIFSRLPGNSKDLIDIDTDKTIPEANVYFIGFCAAVRSAFVTFCTSYPRYALRQYRLSAPDSGDVQNYCNYHEADCQPFGSFNQQSFHRTTFVLSPVGLCTACDGAKSCIFAFLHQYKNCQGNTHHYKNHS